ncbi:MAG: thiamine pyrophosphate-binding protein, partial [Candidatus Omnitrophota bacterium]
MKYNGAEIIIKLLEKFGIKIIPGIPGGSNLPLYDALYKSDIRHILARHEQGAGFIAQGMARSTGKPAVCFATSGPGVTNLVTAMADAKSDSVPIIAITGQVPVPFIGTDAFQEVDTYGMTLPLTKHNFLVKKAEDLLTVIPESFRIASEGRCGPVVIDVPKDVQLERLEVKEWPSAAMRYHRAPRIDMEDILRIAEAINRSERPVLYAGGGVISSGASGPLFELAEKNSIPVASTIMGLGAVPFTHPLFIGMQGMHGSRKANLMFRGADLIIALGTRFGDRATGKVEEFCPMARIIHIDIDRAEINKNREAHIGMEADVKSALLTLLPLIKRNRRKKWSASAAESRGEQRSPSAERDIFKPASLMRFISERAGENAIITTDVGQHQMWAAQ